MANNGVFKTLGPNDTGDSKASLHEQIPVTGTIISGTYGTFPSESNVKFFNTGDHIDVYDYPYASSSANFMFSMTAGYSSNATDNTTNVLVQRSTKNNIYRQFAQQYVGYDTNQDFVDFNVSGVLNPPNTFPPKYDSAVFIDFSRVLMKDEIKKGSFQITIGTASFAAVDAGNQTRTFTDAHAVEGNQSTYKSNSPMGEYSLLQLGSTATVPSNSPYGLLYYQAGLLVLAGSTAVFGNELTSGSSRFAVEAAQTPSEAFHSGNINDIVNGVRHHILNIEFNNTTELNSTTYFLRATNNEFNYSNNPSFVSGSEIIVKAGNASNPSVAYITTVGLYSADNQLLAVGKLSEPLKKTPQDEINVKMRIDY